MAQQTLSQFATAKRTKGYITFSDVRLLEREIVPNGIDSPDVAETLLSMDRLVAAAHPAWAGFLVAAVLAYLEGMTDEATQDHCDVARRLVAWLSMETPARCDQPSSFQESGSRSTRPARSSIRQASRTVSAAA
jgi:hypothetical protein